MGRDTFWAIFFTNQSDHPDAKALCENPNINHSNGNGFFGSGSLNSL
jgi:hypothetical protein